MPHALPLRILLVAVLAVAAVVATAGPLRSQLASQGVEGGNALVAPGPLTADRDREPVAPGLPDGGPNGVAIWVHGDRSPAAPVALLRAAGIPARVVRSFAAARSHPLVLSWPETDAGPRMRLRIRAYTRQGGTFLAVAPSPAVRTAIGGPRTAFFARLVHVPELGLESGGHLRDRQIAALRRFWAATPGGFRLGDAPGAARAALVLLHDVRSQEALRAAPELVRRERATGVRATYVLQTRYLADARGGKLVGPALARLVRAVRAAAGGVVAGGVAGGPLAALPRGDAGELYPLYAAAFASPTEVDGATLSGELRISRYVLETLAGGDVRTFRGASGTTPRGFAEVAEASGIDVDATLPADAAGGAFPFWQAQADGLERRLLRVPVAVDDVAGEGPAAALAAAYVALRRNWTSGAPTLVELTPDRAGCAGAVERALLADTPTDVWRGSLDRFASFWDERAGISLDARPLGAGRGWLVQLRSEGRRAGPIARRALRRGARHGGRRSPARGTWQKPRRAACLRGKDGDRRRSRAHEGQPFWGSRLGRLPPSCESDPAAAHRPLRLRTRLSVGSPGKGRTIADDDHDRILQNRLDQATKPGTGRSLRGALGRVQDQAIEQRIQEERQRILNELQVQFDERLKVLEERERAVAGHEDADGREGLAEQAATTVQLRDAVERQERRIDELERGVESERYRREVAESVLEDPSLMHQLTLEIERLQSALTERERELEALGRTDAGVDADAPAAGPARLGELEGRVAIYEIELLELRARLEDVVDREFVELRESELQAEIGRLAAQLGEGVDADGEASGERERELQRELEEAREQVRRLESESGELAALGEQIAALHETAARAEQLAGELEVVRSAGDTLGEELAGERLSLQEARAQIAASEDAIGRLAELEAQAERGELAARAVADELAAAREQLARLGEQAEAGADIAAELARTEGERDGARARIAELERELPAARARAAEAEVAEQRIAELEGRVADDARRAEAAASALALAQEQAEAAETQLEERAAAASAVIGDLAQARAEAAAERERAGSLAGELAAARAELGALVEQVAAAEAADLRIAQLEGQIAEAAEGSAAVSAALDGTREQLEAAESRLAAQVAAEAAKECELAELRAAAEAAGTRTGELEDELASARGEHAALAARAAAAEAAELRNTQLEALIAEQATVASAQLALAHEQLETAEARLEERDVAASSLQRELTRARAGGRERARPGHRARARARRRARGREGGAGRSARAGRGRTDAGGPAGARARRGTRGAGRAGGSRGGGRGGRAAHRRVGRSHRGTDRGGRRRGRRAGRAA